jgi:hypothetical protein
MDVLRTTYQSFIDGSALETDVLSIWRAVSLALWLHHISLTIHVNRKEVIV